MAEGWAAEVGAAADAVAADAVAAGREWGLAAKVVQAGWGVARGVAGRDRPVAVGMAKVTIVAEKEEAIQVEGTARGTGEETIRVTVAAEGGV